MVADHHPPEVRARLPEPAVQRCRKLQEEPVTLPILQGVPPHLRLPQGLLPPLEAVVDPVSISETGRDAPAEGVDLPRGMTECPRGDPDRSLQRVGGRRGRDRRPELLVSRPQLVPDLVPAQGIEVEVDIGRVGAELVHEPLEE